jgi:hypothetical protein
MARPLTVTVFGNAQLDTAESALGSQSSLLLDGTGDYITIPNDIIDSNANRYFDLGTGGGYPYGQAAGQFDGWRIDFWFRHNTGWLDSDILISSTSTNAGNGWRLTANLNLTTTFGTFIPSSSLYLANLSASGWNKLTLLSNGGTGQLFLNGNKIFTSAQANMGKLLSGGSVVVVGAKKLPNGTVSDDYHGWIDELRIKNGRGDDDTGNATVPVESVQYSGTDALFLSHFNGTDGSTAIVDNFPVTHSASADLSALASQLSVQNPAPSMVYLQNDAYTWADTDTWDTIYDSDDKWAVYERLNASFALNVQAVTFDIGSSQVFGEFTLSAMGGLEQNGNARLENAFTQTAKGGLLIGIDDPYDYTWDTVPEDQWNGFFTDQWRPSGWFAFDAVTLNANGGLALVGQADLTSTAAVAVDARLSDVRGSANLNSVFTQGNVDGRTFLRASADLNSEFTLASGSDNSKSGSATLEAFAAKVTVGRLSDVRGSSELVSQFVLTSGSDLYRNVSSTLEAQANLTIAGAMTLNAGVILDTAFALESNSRILKLANLDITSLGDLSVVGSMTLNAGTSLAGNFTQSVSAGYSLSGSANLAAEFTEIVRPTLIPSVELGELTATASLTVNGVMTFNGVANLEALATEVTVGQRIQGAKANLEAAFTTVIAGSTTLGGRATLEAFAAEIVAGRLSDIRGSATLSGTFVAEFAGELKLLDSQFIYMVLNENRLFGIESEQRTYDVLSENRLFDIEQESRGYQVLPENRTVDVGYFMQ